MLSTCRKNNEVRSKRLLVVVDSETICLILALASLVGLDCGSILDIVLDEIQFGDWCRISDNENPSLLPNLVLNDVLFSIVAADGVV